MSLTATMHLERTDLPPERVEVPQPLTLSDAHELAIDVLHTMADHLLTEWQATINGWRLGCDVHPMIEAVLQVHAKLQAEQSLHLPNVAQAVGQVVLAALVQEVEKRVEG
jgi:hypothetical protein